MDDDYPTPTADEIRAKLADRMRKTTEAGLKRGSSERRTAEQKQRKGRVNGRLLRTQTGPAREPWTFRVRPDLKTLVEDLADELSRPGSKVTVAALMEEAMQLLLAKHKRKADADA